jgi:hypothetical protein
MAHQFCPVVQWHQHYTGPHHRQPFHFFQERIYAGSVGQHDRGTNPKCPHRRSTFCTRALSGRSLFGGSRGDLFALTKMPEVGREEEKAEGNIGIFNLLGKYRHLSLGVLAQFANVGAQATLWGYFVDFKIDFAKDEHLGLVQTHLPLRAGYDTGADRRFPRFVCPCVCSCWAVSWAPT